MDQNNTNAQTVGAAAEDTVQENIPTYTQEQLQQAYNSGRTDGYITAIKQVRSEINDYLSDLLASIRNSQNS